MDYYNIIRENMPIRHKVGFGILTMENSRKNLGNPGFLRVLSTKILMIDLIRTYLVGIINRLWIT